MELPKIENAKEYLGLYVVDFANCPEYAGRCAVGYTAQEVATLLESERFTDIKVYKIHRAKPDGTMELAGVSNERFNLETGMFFNCHDENTAHHDYQTLLEYSTEHAPPCNAKLQLAKDSQSQLIIALIYPAEYEHEISQWLLKSTFRGTGHVDAGISQVQQYYQGSFEILQRHQLAQAKPPQQRDLDGLLAAVGDGVQKRPF